MNQPEQKGTGPLRPKPPREDSEEAFNHYEERSSDNLMDDPHVDSVSLDDILAQLRRKVEEPVDTTPTSQRMLPKLETNVQPWRVIFQTISPEPKVLGLDVHDVTVVGRSDPSAVSNPELDLTPFGALMTGVSRRHAILLPADDGLCLLDLDSTNGTWVNGVYLQPGQKYHLQAGDRVEFGKLRLVVRVVGEMLKGGSDDDPTAVTRSKPNRRR